MPIVHSHYENLKVARDAPESVIRAAYRVLSQKYHPDRNPGDPDAERVMQMLNRAYDVLSDPEKRRDHDAWIRATEQDSAGTVSSAKFQPPPSSKGQSFTVNEAALNPKPQKKLRPSKMAFRVISHVFRNWLIYGIIGIVTWVNLYPSDPPKGPKPYVAEPFREPSPLPRIVKPSYARPPTAPNGQPWPVTANYVKGYQRAFTNGLSSVTIDNSQNDSDVFVKLVSLDGPEARPVRHFFIPGRSKFTVSTIRSGSYDLRHRDLESGRLTRSQAFDLTEAEVEGGRKYSVLTVTLYKVRDGNMQSFPLGEDEFE